MRNSFENASSKKILTLFILGMFISGCNVTPSGRDTENHINYVFQNTMRDSQAIPKNSISGSLWGYATHKYPGKRTLNEVRTEQFLPNGAVLYTLILNNKTGNKREMTGKWVQNGSKVAFFLDAPRYKLCSVTLDEDQSGIPYMGGACHVDQFPELFTTLYKYN